VTTWAEQSGLIRLNYRSLTPYLVPSW